MEEAIRRFPKQASKVDPDWQPPPETEEPAAVHQQDSEPWPDEAPVVAPACRPGGASQSGVTPRDGTVPSPLDWRSRTVSSATLGLTG